MQEMTAKESSTIEENISNIKDIDKKIREYNKLMIAAATNLDFETAISYRDKIKKLEATYLKS